MTSKHSDMRKNFPYTTPDGYFEDLNARLERIPDVMKASERENVAGAQPQRRRSLTARLLPYAALAASFLLAVVVGNFILNRTARPAASDEEIIQYLIDSGTTLAQIESYIPFNE